MSSALDRLKKLSSKISSYELTRKKNMTLLRELFVEIGIDKKVDTFEDLFLFKAINLSGASLLEESLGEIKEGKYLQILAISYDKTAQVKSTNKSLAYYGRVESVESAFKDRVVEFIIRYRFEKSFMNLEHYHTMIGDFGKSSE